MVVYHFSLKKNIVLRPESRWIAPSICFSIWAGSHIECVPVQRRIEPPTLTPTTTPVLLFWGVHKCIFTYFHCSQFTMFHFTLYSQDINIECVWRDIKTIPRPQEFYRAPSSEMFDPPLPLLIHQHE